MKLSEVIREARLDFECAALNHRNNLGPKPADENDCIVAAVAAHLESDEVVERAARGLARHSWDRQDEGGREYYRTEARAAIRAAVGGDDAP